MNRRSHRFLQRYAVPCFVVSIYHYLSSRALISLSARIQLTRRIRFGAGTTVKRFVIVQTSGGKICFGRACALSSFDHFSTGEGDITVGNYVRFGPNCSIVGGTKSVDRADTRIVDQPESRPNGITIGDDVLIGANSVILPATEIERGAVIGAGSVVQGRIPEYAIAVGSPATVISQRN